jgi:hypothetical protein
VHHVAGVERSAVVKADAPAQMKQIRASVRGNIPPGGERWPDLRVGTEASETVEEVLHRAAARNIGGERGVERLWIIAVACVDESAAMRGLTAATCGEHEQRGEGDVWSRGA